MLPAPPLTIRPAVIESQEDGMHLRCFSQRREKMRRRRPRSHTTSRGPTHLSHRGGSEDAACDSVSRRCANVCNPFFFKKKKEDAFPFQMLSIIRWKPPVSAQRFPGTFSPLCQRQLSVFSVFERRLGRTFSLDFVQSVFSLSNLHLHFSPSSPSCLSLVPLLSFPGGRRLQSDSTRRHSQAKDQNTQHR